MYRGQFFRKGYQESIFLMKRKVSSEPIRTKCIEATIEEQSDHWKMGSICTSRAHLDVINLVYVRYVDDFLFGVTGPRSLALKIKKKIVQFVKSDLKLELVGGEVTHVSSGKVLFLGIEISGVPRPCLSRQLSNAMEKKKRAMRNLGVQQKIKEDRTLKVLTLRLKKLITTSVMCNVKNLFKFKVTKNCLFLNDRFTHSNMIVYKEFIKRLFQSQTFVPDSLIYNFKMLENELTSWENLCKRTKSHYFTGKCKKLFVPRIFSSLLLSAPLNELKEKLKLNGLLTQFNRPTAVSRLINQQNHIIVGWFRSVAQGFLEYYRCCRNFAVVKNYVDYFVRWSAIHTLAKKHRMSCREIVFKWSKNLVILRSNGEKFVDFPSSHFIKSMTHTFLSGVCFNAGLLVLNSIWLKFSSLKWFALRCAFKSCHEVSDIEMHIIGGLSRVKNSFGFSSVVDKKIQWVKAAGAFTIASKCNQIPLCKSHYNYLCSNKINFLDLDGDYLRNFE
jgi:Type II intron maturase